MFAMVLCVILMIVLSIVFTVVWSKTACYHRVFSVAFLAVFAILGYVRILLSGGNADEIMLPHSISAIFLILIFTASNGNSGIVTGFLLGVESACACLTALSILPFFPVDIYYQIMMWMVQGGIRIMFILFWPILAAAFFLGKLANDMDWDDVVILLL